MHDALRRINLYSESDSYYSDSEHSACRGEAGVSVSFCFTLSRPVTDRYSSPAVSGQNCSNSPIIISYSSRIVFNLFVGDFTMSKSFQNLLFAFLFLLGHLLSLTMSQLLPGASCPKGKVMVCCYGAPFVCYAWDWPCEDYEVEQCCKRTDVCTSLHFINESKTVVRQAKCRAISAIATISALRVKLTQWLELLTDSDIECRCWCLRRMSGPNRTRDTSRASS